MDREQISHRLESLPTIATGDIPGEDECWEGQEGDVHFIVTKGTMPGWNPIELVSITVSGPPEARLQFVRDFGELLGEPAGLDIQPDDPDAIDSAMWVVVGLSER